MARDSFHQVLQSVPMLSGLSRPELDAVGAATTQLDLEQGKVLMSEGEIGRDMFLVLDGTLEVRRNGGYVADIGQGGFVGEFAILADTPRNATVTAKTDVRVLHLDRRAFAGVLEQVPQIAVKMLPVVARRSVENSALPVG